MNKTLVISLVAIGGIVLGALIFGAGMLVSRSNLGFSGMNPSAMMNWYGRGNNSGYSMMGNGYGMSQGAAPRNGLRNFQSGTDANAIPLTVDQAKQAVEGYLKNMGNSDLVLKEIMIFDNNAYARITEKSTGIGAMELLVDPSSKAVYPEYGPNMMWNLKYGMMSGNGFSGGSYRGGAGGCGDVMGTLNANPASVSSEMTVSAEQALKVAQQYLDQQVPGSQAAKDADPFYGYYTIDIMKDGKPAGMLSVNGFSQQVFLHTWHGTFIEMSE